MRKYNALARIQDRDGTFRLLALLRERFSTITLVWADSGYSGRPVSWACHVLALDGHHRQAQ